MLFLLVPYGVSAQNPVGVFSTRELAEEAAATLWRDSDGYHNFVVQERLLDKVYDNTFSRGLSWAPDRKTTEPPNIQFVPESEVNER